MFLNIQFVRCSGFSEYVCSLRWGQDFELGKVFTGVKTPKNCLANVQVI